MDFFKPRSAHNRVYLDFASATPRDERMVRSFPRLAPEALVANPSALHREGRIARAALEAARTLVAQTLVAHPDEIIFTSGATESDNLALSGLVGSWRAQGVPANDIAIFASDIEHAAVLETLAHHAREGAHVIIIPTIEGVMRPEDIVLPESCTHALVTCMYVNNEIGTVQPIREIAKRLRDLRKQFPQTTVLFHTDATQAPLYYSLRVPSLGVDLMTLGATKLYCARGAGVLYKRRGVTLAPVMRGGGQEYGIRPGTPAVALAHEFAHALAHAQANHVQTYEVMSILRHYLETKVLAATPAAVVTAANAERSPHLSHIALPNFDSELLVIELDARGIVVSAKSACKNENGDESSIVESLHGRGWGAVRLSLGRTTTKKDLDRAIAALSAVVKKYAKH